ncbi:Cfr family 23S rRNA (adenine(2503)-C(8))-methyltransferase [Cohnella zeiphila]|uniref:Ribosomal RNA large subunit methyltransferase Cfr n=1 Tax=Cohnella zeiphila TaxID=2761120 RepID=A0A7X0VXM2_9BACL|nr:Cfr family 23S rRNA (adenine(2503)-C(8))-methyltransferase [Cohnella zeiphila]MBB6734424.1 Cfr family 23S rRNA (adenine(2503)-C(8))-methyltransferase [Cohnella zeiphila]
MQTGSKYEKIREVLSESQQPSYRYAQITEAIFKKRIGEYEKMVALPQSLRNKLVQELGAQVCGIVPAKEITSSQVGKVLFEIAGDERIETVQLHYERGWKSYCVSAQCGCGFGCKFCATGTIGLKRNLTADEITDQLLYFHLNGHSLDSVSFMGMGEALANPNIFDAINILTDPTLFGLGHRRITLSTIGLLPGIERLTRDYPQINLTFSMHSPFDEQRSELMPINKHYSIRDVLSVLDQHIRQTGRKVYIAYLLLRGVNDTIEHAEAIADLLQGRGSGQHLYHVNLIPYNATEVTPSSFRTSDASRMASFVQALKARGIKMTVRTQFGRDIHAACGQLYASK